MTQSRAAETTEQRESRLEKVSTTTAESRETEITKYPKGRLEEYGMRTAEKRGRIVAAGSCLPSRYLFIHNLIIRRTR
jgi:hypothetical protein